MNEKAFYPQAEKFVSWLERRVIEDARGDRENERDSKPADRLWLGRLATVSEARKQAATDRSLRLDPCAAGFTFQPAIDPPWHWNVTFTCRTWRPEGKKDDRRWYKSAPVVAYIQVDLRSSVAGPYPFGHGEIKRAFMAVGDDYHAGHLDVEVRESDNGRPVVTMTVVNETSDIKGRDSNFYEVSLSANVGHIRPFVLDSLPDSFRYDRLVDAYGVNGGVEYCDGVLSTTDFVCAERSRPMYWDGSLGDLPDLTFKSLASNPVPSLNALLSAFDTFVGREWSVERLRQRAQDEGWSDEMLAEAFGEAKAAREEVERCRTGLDLLNEPCVLRAFMLMNEAFVYSGEGKYDSWRPFQMGFLLSSLPGILESSDRARYEVSTLWFATGGGKTETYLAAIVFAALVDRLTGKSCGITAWSRFPLRMLSLDQTQRFADALAAAERVRREHAIEGEPFTLGYFVGNNGTPNKVRFDPQDGAADADDPAMPARYRVLQYCPFCRDRNLKMGFDEGSWRLEHQCTNGACPWPDQALPFFVVDEELFRFLPTVVVGTLDKAASVALQAAMRGFYAAPLGRCSGPEHGFTYAPRSKTPNGCLVPGCQYKPGRVSQPDAVFPPRLRIQDELHLLADSLGAIDSHYETLLDHLTTCAGGKAPKILASSATLMGFEAQVRTLYTRTGSAFPLPGPRDGFSFWSLEGTQKMRRYVALAPRGQTQEFANDRIAEALQTALRDFISNPTLYSNAAGVDPAYADDLIKFYGVHVIYGSKLRDVEGAARSLESQPPAEPTNVVTLLGNTPLATVLNVLERLRNPEKDFLARIHVACASSMMSHGVDVDRFNVMTMIGMPLSTAEFIQTSARIGRRFPGLVFVLQRMAVERDAKIYRSFAIFVKHGDRLIEPVAITRNSRRVFERTAPGMFMADVLGLYEPKWIAKGNKALTTPKEMRKYVHTRADFASEEAMHMGDALSLDIHSQAPMATELEKFIDELMSNINDPASSAKFTSDLAPGKILISLRDVEERVPIREAVD